MIFQKPLLFLLTLIIPGWINLVSGQTIKLKDNISFVANNISVSEALETLSSQTGNTFSYNPDHIPTSKIVKVDLRDRSLSDVLHAILGTAGFEFKQIGNQVVLFRSKEMVPVSLNNVENEPDPNSLKSVKPPSIQQDEKPDTIYMYRDIHDTIKVTEYITKTDTIIQKIPTPVSGNEIFRNTTVLGDELSNHIKLEIGVSMAIFFSDPIFSGSEIHANKLKEYNNSFLKNTLSGTAGIDINATYQKWMVTSGIKYTSFSQKMDYNYFLESGGYYKTDTLDAYYELIDGEQNWTYLTDSVYVPVDNELYDYKITNYTRYIELPLTVGFNYPVSHLLIYAKAGMITGIFLSSDGQQINVNDNGVISLNEIESKKVVFSYTASVGISIPLTRKLIISPAIFYRNHFGSIYENFPIETKFSAFGLSAGLSFKL